ncbi:hypothetical protein AUK40_01125 [Candidatus Wirthbacteria bacterium CG2_30_54_11]|uniref:Uncharacterized protein n=1 Tax=Candidatus Wirthbacteria bacterium CG2_30_54_11 TaxID=1817892 RepID=A0A1J5J5J2_9BACT|nr:MAG: hypothetical protein AUK40_01125 [Candidatus Wirthbacteria bacterium CG2_30_54_11]
MFIIRWFKRIIFWIIVSLAAVAFFLSRCSVEDWYREITTNFSVQTAPVSIPEAVTPFVNSLKAALSDELKVSADQISVEKAEFILWPDSCLGIVRTDRSCTSVVTPGYKIILKANGSSYEFHGDQKGAFERKV